MVMTWLKSESNGESSFTPLYYETHASLSKPMPLRGSELPGIMSVPYVAADEAESGEVYAGSGPDIMPVGRLHTTPSRMWLIVLEGSLHVGTSTGEVTTMHPGDALLADDLTGRGHTVVADGACQRCLIMRIPLMNRKDERAQSEVSTEADGCAGSGMLSPPVRYNSLPNGASSITSSSVASRRHSVTADLAAHSWAPAEGGRLRAQTEAGGYPAMASFPLGRPQMRSPMARTRPTNLVMPASVQQHAGALSPRPTSHLMPVPAHGEVPGSAVRRGSPSMRRDANGLEFPGISLSGGGPAAAQIALSRPEAIGSMPLGSQSVGQMGYRLVARMSSLQGLKQNLPGCPNQDSHLIADGLGDGKVLVAVFDGHGREGHRVSSRATEVFGQHAQSLARLSGQELSDELVNVFSITHQVLEEDGFARWSGTTATMALVSLQTGTAVVAHVGDSTLMICNGPNVEFVSRDHRIEDAEEQRIIESGGEVRTAVISGVTARRVYLPGKNLPGLAMSRALGDVEAHTLGVLSVPDIHRVPFSPSSTLVVASDGVWDRFPAHQVADFVARNHTQRASALAMGMVAEARSRWPGPDDVDDITAVVLRAEAR